MSSMTEMSIRKLCRTFYVVLAVSYREREKVGESSQSKLRPPADPIHNVFFGTTYNIISTTNIIIIKLLQSLSMSSYDYYS